MSRSTIADAANAGVPRCAAGEPEAQPESPERRGQKAGAALSLPCFPTNLRGSEAGDGGLPNRLKIFEEGLRGFGLPVFGGRQRPVPAVDAWALPC